MEKEFAEWYSETNIFLALRLRRGRGGSEFLFTCSKLTQLISYSHPPRELPSQSRNLNLGVSWIVVWQSTSTIMPCGERTPWLVTLHWGCEAWTYRVTSRVDPSTHTHFWMLGSYFSPIQNLSNLGLLWFELKYFFDSSLRKSWNAKRQMSGILGLKEKRKERQPSISQNSRLVKDWS